MKLRNRVAVLVALLASGSALQGGFFAARAQETTRYSDVYDNILNAVGFGKARDPIDYTTRAPLAVPPSNDLPSPETSAAQRPAGFPKDPDVFARRRALADPRRPVPPAESGARAYLIDPPAPYFDASAVAATGNNTDKGEPEAAKPKRRRKPAATATQ